MTISGKYELVKPVRAAGFRSFHARHVLTGMEVMVHFLNQGQRYEPRPPVEASGADRTLALAQVLDAGTYEDTPFLVTYPIEDFTTLAAWLESVAPFRRSAVTPAAERPIPPPQQPVVPVEFRDVSPRKPASGGFPARFEPSPTDQPPQVATPGSSSGEFTAMFGGLTNPPPAAPASPRGPAPEAAESGGFTAMFGSSAAVPAPPPFRPAQPMYQPKPPAPAVPGSHDEFGRMFLPEGQGPLPSAPVELSRPNAPAPAPSRAPAGEFTLLFSGLPDGGPVVAPPAAAPLRLSTFPVQTTPAQPARPSPPTPSPLPVTSHDVFEGATQVFQGPGQLARSGPPQQAIPMSPSGPGEFTMIIRGEPGNAMPPAGHFPPPPGANATPSAFPAPAFQAPAFQAPQISTPSLTGPSISGSGFTPPAFQAPQVQAPSMTAPQVSLPGVSSMAVAPPGSAIAPAAGSGFSPILAAVLACLGTIALLAIVYVLIKR